MNPIVSIIVPAYNAEKYIVETLESVLSQTSNEWECIVVNDGSTDATEKAVQPFLHDNRFLLIQQENKGVSAARNNGIKKARGKYLLFLDADDVLLPRNLETKIALIQQNSNPALLHNWVQVIDGDSKSTGEIKKGKEGKVLKDLLLWEQDVIPAPSSALVKTEIAMELGGFDESLSTAADQDFFIRLAAKYSIVMIKEVLSQYRILPQSMSRNISVMEKEHVEVYEKAKQTGLFETKQFKKKCFANLYLILAGSWSKHGNNKAKALKYVWKAMATYPPIITKLVQKI